MKFDNLPQALSQALGIVVIFVWAMQAVLVVWTLTCLGHRQSTEENGMQLNEV
jgi:hypothetical protein